VAFGKQDARILVVDDDRELANGLVEHLSGLGYSATLINNSTGTG